jgi:tetratricopeptide (TPR) repeat protein
LDLANQELVVLSKLTRRHPLLSEITAYLSRGGKAADAGPISSAIPASSATAVAVGASAGGDPSESGASYQDLLRRAHDAHKAGDTAKAESLYRAVLAKNPQDTEALGGLGDIARERGDKSASLRYYQEVTRQNPGYLPALIGMADAKWDSGDKAGAVALYRQIVDRVGGQGPYADKARQRISASQSSGGAAGATTSAPTVTSSPAPTSSGSKPATPAGVDTSDLPGWKP